jgi:hypothetical protein
MKEGWHLGFAHDLVNQLKKVEIEEEFCDA